MFLSDCFVGNTPLPFCSHLTLEESAQKDEYLTFWRIIGFQDLQQQFINRGHLEKLKLQVLNNLQTCYCGQNIIFVSALSNLIAHVNPETVHRRAAIKTAV